MIDNNLWKFDKNLVFNFISGEWPYAWIFFVTSLICKEKDPLESLQTTTRIDMHQSPKATLLLIIIINRQLHHRLMKISSKQSKCHDNVNAVVFLDLKRAFDPVDHAILLSKLKAYGVKNTSYTWFKSYLNSRKQKCFVNGSLSDSQHLRHSTGYNPRSSSIYTLYKRFACLSNSQPRMYADDMHLTFGSNDITHLEQGLNEDLAKVNEWLVTNKLTLNKSKTEFMLIGSS